MESSLPRTLTRLSALALVLIGLVTACTASPAAPSATPVASAAATTAATPTASAVPGGTVTLRLGGDWAHIDPSNASTTPGAQGGQIAVALYDTLITVGRDGKLVPYLAKSWDQTPTSIKFTLRSDATCSDGTKVTPGVAKASIERTMKASGNVGRMGAGPFTITADETAGTVTWTTATPFVDAIYGFVVYQGSIVCPKGIADPDSLKDKPQGSGPFVLDSMTKGDQVVLTARPEWSWGPDGLGTKSPGFPQKLIFKVVANETTAANLLLTGGLDVAQIAGPDVDRLQADKSLLNKTIASQQTFPLVFNHQTGRPTADAKVREALVTAFTQEDWNQAAYKGRGNVSPTFLEQGADCYDASMKQYLPATRTPQKAKEVLLAAGWTTGPNGKLQKDGKPLVVNLVATNTNTGSGPDYLAAQWDAAGITVKADISDFNTYLQRLLKSDFDVLPEQLAGSTPNPNDGIPNFLGPFPAQGGFNWPQAVNADAEKELALARSTVGAERCTHWTNVQRLMLQQFTYTPLSSPQVQWFGRGIDVKPGVGQIDPRYFKRVS